MKAKKAKAGSSKASADAKHKLFGMAYIANGGNGTQAAITAGYSPKTAKVQAVRLLTYASVKALIAKNAKAVSEKMTLTMERTLREVARIAYFDPRKLVDVDGNTIPLHKLDDDTAAAVASVEYDDITADEPANEKLEPQDHGGALKRRTAIIGKKIKYRVVDKNVALEKAMKHLGLYKADNMQKPAEYAIVHQPGKRTFKLESFRGRERS